MEFPYYLVYFKARFIHNDWERGLSFPYYLVYFKAQGQEPTESATEGFPYYLVYFKAFIDHYNLDLAVFYFHTI